MRIIGRRRIGRRIILKVNTMELGELLESGRRDDVDEIGLLMMATYLGLDRVREWSSRSGLGLDCPYGEINRNGRRTGNTTTQHTSQGLHFHSRIHIRLFSGFHAFKNSNLGSASLNSSFQSSSSRSLALTVVNMMRSVRPNWPICMRNGQFVGTSTWQLAISANWPIRSYRSITLLLHVRCTLF